MIDLDKLRSGVATAIIMHSDGPIRSEALCKMTDAVISVLQSEVDQIRRDALEEAAEFCADNRDEDAGDLAIGIRDLIEKDA